MGHREDLLVGAKRCLIEKGYARTTARDIVAASGANLASIGYHYGSKEALLNQALMESISELGDELARALSTADPELAPIERFGVVWNHFIERFASHRAVWAASFEAFAQVDHVPVIREALAEGIEQGRSGIISVFQEVGTLPAQGDQSPPDERAVRSLGSFYQALFTGVMAQMLVDPERAPSGADLAEALRLIVGAVEAGHQCTGAGAGGAGGEEERRKD